MVTEQESLQKLFGKRKAIRAKSSGWFSAIMLGVANGDADSIKSTVFSAAGITSEGGEDGTETLGTGNADGPDGVAAVRL